MRLSTWIGSAAIAAALIVSSGCRHESAPAKPASPAAPYTAKPAAPAAPAKPAAPSSAAPAAPAAPVAPHTAKPAAPAAPAAPIAAAKAIRIDCGAAAPLTDKAGNTWLADTGFADGDVVDRLDIVIEGTTTPEIYRTEHFGMTSFSQEVPNGKYTVKLHFCETYDGIMAAGERVFSANVEGVEIKGIDPFKDGGGLNKPSVKSADVEVKDGKLDITFTADVQNPEINAIEIIPQ